MSCLTGSVGSVYFVRWRDPAVEDITTIVKEVSELHEAMKIPCIYVAIIPAGVRSPDERVRRAMTNSMPKMLECCGTLHFVIEGTGFNNALARTALAATLLLASARGRTFVHKSVDEVFEATPVKFRGGEPATILRIAAARQLLTVT